MDSSAAANGRLAALEDEVKIIKGEVKQVLTEIRSAILAKDSPFEEDSASRAPRPVHIVPAVVDQPARVEPVRPVHEEQTNADSESHSISLHHEPALLEPHRTVTTPQHAAEREQSSPERAPAWSLLTIANIASWAEEALERVGAQRLGILLQLCELSGYLTPEERTTLSGVTALDVPAPDSRASAGDVAVLLNQLEALIRDEHRDGRRAALRRA